MNEPVPLIEFRNVTKRFAGVVALDGVSLDVRAGELHAICGENGAGKSTLMKLLAGVLTDYEGEFRLRGETVRFASARDAEAAGVSIIHQELNLVDQLSAAANIFLGREMRSRWGLIDDRAMEAAAERLLAELECSVPAGQLCGTMRVGDQQLVEIAKALSLEAEILIMDEPTSALTDAEVARLDRVIDRLRVRGVTILYISHKMDEVFRLADRITVLRDGRLVRTLERRETNPQEITHLMVGREIEAVDFGNTPRRAGDELLRVESLRQPWPGHARKWRLEDVSFSLSRGEILGVAGLMGAGRSELLECLFGAASEPPQGRIFLRGRQVSFRHPQEALAAGVAMLAEDRKRLGLFAEMTVAQNMTISSLREVLSRRLLSRRAERQVADQCAHDLDVRTPHVELPITALSGGNQQKTLLGRCLLTRPAVLLLDDPTRGVDVSAKAEIYRLMDRLCRDGMAILLTSSELPELLTVCDRILVLCEGRLTAEFTRSEASEERIMEAATALTAGAAAAGNG